MIPLVSLPDQIMATHTFNPSNRMIHTFNPDSHPNFHKIGWYTPFIPALERNINWEETVLLTQSHVEFPGGRITILD